MEQGTIDRFVAEYEELQKRRRVFRSQNRWDEANALDPIIEGMHTAVAGLGGDGLALVRALCKSQDPWVRLSMVGELLHMREPEGLQVLEALSHWETTKADERSVSVLGRKKMELWKSGRLPRWGKGPLANERE